MISKIANWVVWTALTVLVLLLVYWNTNWFKPAAERMLTSVRTATASVTNAVGGGEAAKPEDKINNAREYFARGDVDGAVAVYSELIQANPSDADARGELGNVYYLTGRPYEAAQAFYDAAKLLLDKRDFQRVAALLPAIGQINPMMADELAYRMAELNSNQAAAQAPAGTSAEAPKQAPQSALTRY